MAVTNNTLKGETMRSRKQQRQAARKQAITRQDRAIGKRIAAGETIRSSKPLAKLMDCCYGFDSRHGSRVARYH